MTSIAVIRFPGSNCETETLAALQRAGAEGCLVDYRATALPDVDGVILPGGFSYGDYLRSGAIARFAPVMPAVRALAESGGAVVGICNGFQILCEAQLLPGALQRNLDQRFVSRPVGVRIERGDTVCTVDFAVGDILRVPVAHGDGRYVASPETLASLIADRGVVLRYVAEPGVDVPGNPNGSVNDIAGICNAAGNVIGFMPHPERDAGVDPSSRAGLGFFTSLVRFAAAVHA